MYVERELREQLAEICNAIYGKPSFWMKILKNGEVVKTIEETEKGPRQIHTRKRYTPESLLAEFYEVKTRVNESISKGDKYEDTELLRRKLC